jgi:flagellar assembly factor FliW
MSASLLVDPATSSAPAAESLAVSSDLLGALAVPAEAVHAFPEGLYGFPEARQFALVPAGREGLAWLQSLERSGLTFLLADPFHFFAGYEADVPDAELAHLGIAADAAAGAIALYAIVTLPGTAGETASVNLRAPLVLAPGAQRGRQVVLPDATHGVREPLALG